MDAVVTSHVNFRFVASASIFWHAEAEQSSWKDGDEVEYISELERSLVMEHNLRTLIEEKKLLSLDVVCVPGAETTPTPTP